MLKSKIEHYIKDVLVKNNEIDLYSNSLNQILDSLDMVTFFSFIEEEFGIDLFEDSNNIDFESLQSIIKFIDCHFETVK